MDAALNQHVPVVPSRSVVNESPDLPQFANMFRLGLDDTLKSNHDLDGALVAGSIGAGLGLLARIARSVE